MSTPQNLQPQALISFIVTAYNIPLDMLTECLDSIMDLSLNCHERQIIFVDDGSNSSPINELERYRDHIIYIRQPNQGPSAARNTGLQLATGKFIQFIDADDFLIRAPYEHCVDIIRYQEADLVLFLNTQNRKPEVPLLYEGPITGTALLHRQNIHATCCSYIFKKSILGTLRFTKGVIHEDEEFTPLLILRAEHVYLTKAKAYFYRQRKGSIMHNKDPRHIDQRFNDMFVVLRRLQEVSETAPEIERVALSRRVAQLSMDYLINAIRLYHSHAKLQEAIANLRKYGLFPLPDKKYTKNYSLFRHLIHTRIGQRILLLMLR